MKKLIISLILALVLIVVIALPAFAISHLPDVLTINSVNVYQNVISSGDMMFLTDFEVNYVALPSETIETTYQVRLRFGATDLSTVYPFAYFNNGWGRGIVGMYFTPEQVSTYAMTFGSGAYTMYLEGQATASWDAPPIPTTNTAAFSWITGSTVSANQIAVANKILFYAQTLQTAWNSSSFVLWQTIDGYNFLTTQGSAYFSIVIPYIETICPQILPTFPANVVLLTNNATIYGHGYTTGTVTLVNGSANVVGVGTAWISGFAGWKFKGNADGVYYTISSVTDANNLVLSSVFTGTGGAGLAYTITGEVAQSNLYNVFDGSVFDLSDLGTQWGLPRQLLSSILAVIAMMIVVVGCARKVNSYKPAVLLLFPMIVGFTLLTWLPIAGTILMVFLAFAATAYIFTYEKANI